MSKSNGKWLHAFENYLDRFGLVKFAELNSLNINDYERGFKHYLSKLKSKIGEQFSEHKFGEIDNKYILDFSKAFTKFFS